MELTTEEKDFLIKLLNQLNFNVESLEQGVLTKGIVEKLQKVVDKEEK